MKRRRTQDERIEETRERLLTAAVKILSKQGFANFRIAEVSDVSGVSRGGLIHHYPTKNALVAGVLDYVFARLMKSTEAKLENAHDAASATAAIAESGLDFFFGPDFPIYIDLVMATRQGGTLPKTTRAMAQRQSLSIEDSWTSSLVSFGLDEPTARNIVGLLWSLMRGLAIKAIGNGDTKDRDRIIQFALKAVQPYLNHDPASR
jgi:AcrR family transcriptional regulator